MILADFVRTLPKTWATAPIYAAGVTLPNGKIACGKSPLGRASKEDLSPECTANYINDSPETFQAVGVYSGTRSGGLVIFDVDRNLGAIEEKWGADLEKAPCVRSTKKNAAKFLFVVPEYNGRVPGAFKNTLDYCRGEYKKKPMAIATVSGGPFGGVNALYDFRDWAHYMEGILSPTKLLVSKAGVLFSEHGVPVEEHFNLNYPAFLDDFLWLTQKIAK